MRVMQTTTSWALGPTLHNNKYPLQEFQLKEDSMKQNMIAPPIDIPCPRMFVIVLQNW